jgi:hypothetical protein
MRDNPTFLLTICASAASNALAGRLGPAQIGIARALEGNPDLRASNLTDLTPFRRAKDSPRSPKISAKQAFLSDHDACLRRPQVNETGAFCV